MLVTVCGITYLIHLTVKPYNKELLNKLDNIILHITFFTAALPLLENYDSPLVITTAFVLVISPWLVIMCTLHEANLKKFAVYVISKYKSICSKHGTPMTEISLTVQNVNATAQRDM